MADCQLHGSSRCSHGWCRFCEGGETHWQLYKHQGWNVPPPTPYQPKSQKVLGIRALAGLGHFSTVPIQSVIPANIEQQAFEKLHLIGFPYFARPCPVRPRHGFVDSRLVLSKPELWPVIEETLKADPEGEVMLCTPIMASHNLLWTPTLLTIGKGNDGATAGKDTVNFPLSGIIDSYIMLALDGAKIDIDESPYIEAVVGDYAGIVLTQLRAGPKMTKGLDCVPTEMVVKNIIKVDPTWSLLEWETRMVECPKGTVVWHPGGSPADHFSVHARAQDVPLLITREPTLGETLSPTPETGPSPDAVLKGIMVGERLKLDTASAAQLMLLAFHNGVTAEGEMGWWLGLSVALMLRLGCIALRGEARHIADATGKAKPERIKVYQRTWNFSLSRHRASLPRIIHIHRYGRFSGSGYGGQKWAECGVATTNLFNAVRGLAIDPSKSTLDVLIKSLNIAINQAHNGGWWLNKFTGQESFTYAQNGSLSFIFKQYQSILNATQAMEQLGDAFCPYTKWKELDLTPPPLGKGKALFVPGVRGICLRLEDRILKKARRDVMIDPVQLVEKLPSMLKGDLYVTVTPNGLAVDMIAPHTEPVRIWEESPLKPQSTSKETEE